MKASLPCRFCKNDASSIIFSSIRIFQESRKLCRFVLRDVKEGTRVSTESKEKADFANEDRMKALLVRSASICIFLFLCEISRPLFFPIFFSLVICPVHIFPFLISRIFIAALATKYKLLIRYAQTPASRVQH